MYKRTTFSRDVLIKILERIGNVPKTVRGKKTQYYRNGAVWFTVTELESMPDHVSIVHPDDWIINYTFTAV